MCEGLVEDDSADSSKSDDNEAASSWILTARPDQYHSKGIVLLSVATKIVLAGVVVGMATFILLRSGLRPAAVPWWAPVAVIVFTGIINVWLYANLARGVVASIVTVVVGIGVHVMTWTAPLFLVDYPAGAVDLLFPSYAGEALSGGILLVPLSYYGGYFTALTVAGYFFD